MSLPTERPDIPDMIFVVRGQRVMIDADLARLKYSSTMPCALTQEGVGMLSGVLKSERAIQVNVEIMRVFVRLRREALAYAEISRRLDALEAKYDDSFASVFDALRALVAHPMGTDRLIGLRIRERINRYRAKDAG